MVPAAHAGPANGTFCRRLHQSITRHMQRLTTPPQGRKWLVETPMPTGQLELQRGNASRARQGKWLPRDDEVGGVNPLPPKYDDASAAQVTSTHPCPRAFWTLPAWLLTTLQNPRWESDQQKELQPASRHTAGSSLHETRISQPCTFLSFFFIQAHVPNPFTVRRLTRKQPVQLCHLTLSTIHSTKPAFGHSNRCQPMSPKPNS